MSEVVTSALGSGSDGTSSRDVFSLVPVTEIHWLSSDLLAFPDTDNTFLSFCLWSQDPFSQVPFFFPLGFRLMVSAAFYKRP